MRLNQNQTLMKNLRLLLLALLVAGSAKAQYYQQTYGNAGTNEVLESGVNCIGPVGKLMTGYSDFGTPGQNQVMVTRTNTNGAIGGLNAFNTSYFLVDAATGAPYYSQGRRVVQLTTGLLAIWGDFTDVAGAVPDRYFLLVLNPNGTVNFIRSYRLNSAPMEVQATSMVESTSAPGTIFTLGYSVNAVGTRTPVAMSLNGANGAINWSWEYTDLINPGSNWMANDLEESPFPTSTGVPDIAIVGRYAIQPGAMGDGCFFTVSTATGLPTNFLFLYGTPADEQSLEGITIANNAGGSGPGFAVCGKHYSNIFGAPSFSTWAMKLNPNGSIVNWSALHDYSLIGNDDAGYDIIERLNTAGAYEYYVGGVVVNGIFGASDAVVYKMNAIGGPVPNNQFTYGGPGRDDARQLGQQNAAPIGLTTFGNTANSFPLAPGAADFYMIKSYFNGVSPCNTNIANSLYNPGPLKYDSLKFDTNFVAVIGKVNHQPAAMNNAQLCFAIGVAGGNNLRVAPNPQTAMIAEVYPNPVSGDNAIITIVYDQAGTSRDAEIQLVNTLGQLYLKRSVNIADGQTELQINLGSGLSRGIYHLIIRDGEEVYDYKISVQ